MSMSLKETGDRIAKELKSNGKSNVSLDEVGGGFELAEQLVKSIALHNKLQVKVQRNKKSVTARVEDSK